MDFDFIILDSFSLLFRAFHSFPLTLTSPKGELTNAVYGFTRLLLDSLEKLTPEYFVAATDMGKPTFRHQQFTQYKATRTEAPSELKSQIHFMYEMLDALNMPTLGVVGYEADDVIGTLVTRVRQEHPDFKIGVLTGDRDSFQLVQENVWILQPPRKSKGWFEIVDTVKVHEHFGVAPNQVVDYKALCGDSSDNIPGVKGIGPKTASKLLQDFGTLERLYAAIALGSGLDIPTERGLAEIPEAEKQTLVDAIKKVSTGTLTKLAENQENAWISQQLARIDTQVPLDFLLEQAKLCDYDKGKANQLFDELGFSSLKKHLPNDTFEQQVQASLFG